MNINWLPLSSLTSKQHNSFTTMSQSPKSETTTKEEKHPQDLKNESTSNSTKSPIKRRNVAFLFGISWKFQFMTYSKWWSDWVEFFVFLKWSDWKFEYSWGVFHSSRVATKFSDSKLFASLFFVDLARNDPWYIFYMSDLNFFKWLKRMFFL